MKPLPIAASKNSIASTLNYTGFWLRLKCDGHCSKQGKAIFTNGRVLNFYIAYEKKL